MKILAALSTLLMCHQLFAFSETYTVETKVISTPGGNLTIVILDGSLNRGVAKDTIAALNSADGSDIYLELNSRGGYLTEAEEIYNRIKSLKEEGKSISTFVASGSVCASACTVIFAAGEKRVAGEAASFMVHGVQRESMPGFIDSLKTKHVLELYKLNGISEEWIKDLRVKGVFGGVNDFWFPGRDAALKEVGFATSMTSGLIENVAPPIDPQIRPR